MSLWTEIKEIKSSKNTQKMMKILFEVHWDTVFAVFAGYIGAIIGLYQLLAGQWKGLTYPWVFLIYALGGIGQSVAGHRLFAHRSFKASKGFKRFLIFCHVITGQKTLILWCGSHRAHHKFTDTEKDPTNINRGFLFAHFYWKFWFSPEVEDAMKSMDISDLLEDEDIMFQYRYYYLLFFIFTLGMPVLIPYMLWGEGFWIALYANAYRWVLNHNQMSLANSLLHMNGTRPYDNRISARENLFVNLYTFGEGYHNYHHVFPWDYKTAEFGNVSNWNLSAWFIDACAKQGWVTERKSVTPEMIAKRKARTGDESDWLAPKNVEKNSVWGYGDIDMDIDDKMDIHAFYKDDYFKDE